MAKQNHVRVKAVCNSCDGTGLYSGMCEPKGTAVICHTCNGTGCEVIRYTPFKKRRLRRDIEKVRDSRGRFLMSGTGPTGDAVTYKEFLQGKRP